MKNKVVWNELRTYSLEFALILDPVIYKKITAQMGVPHSQFPSTCGCTVWFHAQEGRYRRVIVTLNPRPETTGIQIAAMLAHEAQHIVQGIEEYIGERKFSEEAECYLLQHIVQDLMQDYCNLRERNKHVRKR